MYISPICLNFLQWWVGLTTRTSEEKPLYFSNLGINQAKILLKPQKIRVNCSGTLSVGKNNVRMRGPIPLGFKQEKQTDVV